ncbi:MAG: hypothetical protein M3177_04360 [Pseudomonadota bacterium]|nr:hypothetical protein [Pseudomonadota bacterium]
MADDSFTSADFHNVVHKQIANAVFETLAQEKLDWELIAPFLEAARSICRSEFKEAARIRFHSVRAEGDQWVAAEEAFLGISVPDRDDGQEWLSETYWVSDIVLADQDPAHVRLTLAALERSIAKIQAWLAEREKGGSDGSA